MWSSAYLDNRERGMALKQQAVLFRTSHHSGPLEIELVRRNVPFVKFGGLKFLDAAHIKDVLAMLRFVENPRDQIAGFRLMQILPGVGPASAQSVLDHMATAAEPLRALADAPAPPRAGEDWPDFVATILGSCRREKPDGRRNLNAHVFGTSRIWTRIYEDAVLRRADLIQLEPDRRDLSITRALFDRTHFGSTGC